MKNETIDAVADDYTRGRLQAIQDLIEAFDKEAGKLRAEMTKWEREVDAFARSIHKKYRRDLPRKHRGG